MEERLAGSSLEGWRMRRPAAGARARPLRAGVLGDDPASLDAARRLALLGIAEVIVSAPSPAAATRAADALAGAARATVLLDGAAPLDALVLIQPDAGRAADAALWAARTCPKTSLIIAALDGLALCVTALRASGLPPWLILSTGCLPRARAEEAWLSGRLGIHRTQICVPALGGDPPHGERLMRRYATAAGVPLAQIDPLLARRWLEEPEPRPARAGLVRAAVRLARAVLLDRMEILSCGAWVQGAFGIEGAYVSLPVRVGCRGAEQPLQARLTLDERAFLQAAALSGA